MYLTASTAKDAPTEPPSSATLAAETEQDAGSCDGPRVEGSGEDATAGGGSSSKPALPKPAANSGVNPALPFTAVVMAIMYWADKRQRGVARR